MASHHHQTYHPYHQPTAASATTTTCYCCCSYTNYAPCHHPLPPDPHLPPLSPHIHHPPPGPHPYPSFPSTYTPQSHQRHPSQPHYPDQYHHHLHHQEDQIEPIISSLIRRISALEAALKGSSTSASYSLRDAAARTIQTRFRAFLVRRSTTLGQLKELASIKSTLNALKSSVSGNARFDSQALSFKAMDLLISLEYIQGSDPMIRDGKRSIRRELNRFMELIGGVYVERSEISSRIGTNVRSGGSNSKSRVLYSNQKRGNSDSVMLGRRGNVSGTLREQIRRIQELDLADEDAEEDLESLNASLERNNGVSFRTGGIIKGYGGANAKVKKNVSFAENGNVYRIIQSSDKPVLDGECNSADESDSADGDYEIIDNHQRKNEEIGASSRERENDEEEEGSPRDSDSGNNETYSFRSRGEAGKTSYNPVEDGSFTFPAPFSVKMESKADLMNRRKSVRE